MHKQGLFPVDCQETPAETDSRTSELTGARTQEEGTTRLAHHLHMQSEEALGLPIKLSYV